MRIVRADEREEAEVDTAREMLTEQRGGVIAVVVVVQDQAPIAHDRPPYARNVCLRHSITRMAESLSPFVPAGSGMLSGLSTRLRALPCSGFPCALPPLTYSAENGVLVPIRLLVGRCVLIGIAAATVAMLCCGRPTRVSLRRFRCAERGETWSLGVRSRSRTGLSRDATAPERTLTPRLHSCHREYAVRRIAKHDHAAILKWEPGKMGGGSLPSGLPFPCAYSLVWPPR
jgi:hypothetical protein